MRIISGIAGGRKLLAPEGKAIRPTSDKVRGAIFNSLRSKIDFASVSVLDVFCGSGALGLEAISQGAGSCVFIDNNKKSLDLAKENAAALKFADRSKFIFSDAAKLKANDAGAAALAFLDPPYHEDLINPALAALEQGWLAPGAVLVLEAEKSYNSPLPLAFTALDEKIYGDTKVTFVNFTR